MKKQLWSKCASALMVAGLVAPQVLTVSTYASDVLDEDSKVTTLATSGETLPVKKSNLIVSNSMPGSLFDNETPIVKKVDLSNPTAIVNSKGKVIFNLRIDLSNYAGKQIDLLADFFRFKADKVEVSASQDTKLKYNYNLKNQLIRFVGTPKRGEVLNVKLETTPERLALPLTEKDVSDLTTKKIYSTLYVDGNYEGGQLLGAIHAVKNASSGQARDFEVFDGNHHLYVDSLVAPENTLPPQVNKENGTPEDSNDTIWKDSGPLYSYEDFPSSGGGNSGENNGSDSNGNKPGTNNGNKPGTNNGNKPGTNNGNKPGTNNGSKPGGNSGSNSNGSNNPVSKPSKPSKDKVNSGKENKMKVYRFTEGDKFVAELQKDTTFNGKSKEVKVLQIRSKKVYVSTDASADKYFYYEAEPLLKAYGKDKIKVMEQEDAESAGYQSVDVNLLYKAAAEIRGIYEIRVQNKDGNEEDVLMVVGNYKVDGSVESFDSTHKGGVSVNDVQTGVSRRSTYGAITAVVITAGALLTGLFALKRKEKEELN